MKERMMMKTLGVWCLVVLITVAPGCAGWSQPSAEQQAQITELRKLIDSGVSETQAAFAKYKLGQLTAVDLSAVVEAVVQKTQDANAKILALQSSGVSPWQSLLNVLVPIAASLGGALLLDKSVKTAAVTESTQRVRAERGPARVPITPPGVS